MRHFLGIAVLTLLMYPIAMRAQEPHAQQLTAPPPLKIISAEDRTQLGDTKDTKARVRRTIELAEGYLLKAEGHTSKDQFTEASAELGKYWALIEDVLRYLSPLDHDKTKTRDLYKRLELALRAHYPRLMLMRRNTPVEFAVWIKEIEDFTRTSRTEALNSFYGHTVVRESQQELTTEKPPPKRSRGLVPPESKQP
jgi:hypothetical protein